ncbi:MAG: tetratricopeptide repeat protein [Polyangiaceae bacterium]
MSAPTGEPEWVMIGLDEKVARRQGLPWQMPVPKEHFEALADKGLPADKARAWASDFLNNTEVGKNAAWRKKNNKLFISLQNFIDKGPLWQKAQKAFAENDFEKAISNLKKITVLDDDDHSAKLNLASAYANQAQYESALKQFKACRATYEGDADYHMAVGQVHVAMRKNDEAINEMVLALEAKPDHQGALDTMVKLGVLTRIYENPKDAGSLIFVRSDSVLDYLKDEWSKPGNDGLPRTVDFFLEQLTYHEREQRWHVALAAAELAIAAAEKAEGDSAALIERAELARISCLRSLGRNDEALAAARAYAERNPKSGGVHVEIARVYRALGKTEEATAEVKTALEKDPGDLSALQLRFWPEDTSDLHTVNATIPELQAFSEAHAEHPGVWRSLARAKLVVGRLDEGIDLLKKAVKLRESDDDLRSELWAELAKQQRWTEIIDDSKTLGDMKKRDWKLRWNEAEAYLGEGKQVEARALFSAINFDEDLHVDIRRRAKRAVQNLDDPTARAVLPGSPEAAAAGEAPSEG